MEAVLGCPLPGDHQIRDVRNVAPGKEMMCVQFRLTREVLFTHNTGSFLYNEQ